MATDQELAVAEFELYRDKALEAMARADFVIQEGAWTGSHGGHDPDKFKLKGNLLDWWRKKAKTDPHPFAYCVRHLRKRFPNPERICAWLKDQALGTTKWRKGSKKVRESVIDNYEPTVAELKAAIECFEEAERDARAGASTETAVQEAEIVEGREVEQIDFTESGQKITRYTDGTEEVG